MTMILEMSRLGAVLGVTLLWAGAFYIIKTNKNQTLETSAELRGLVRIGAIFMILVMFAVVINTFGDLPPTNGVKFLAATTIILGLFLVVPIFKDRHR